MRYGFIAEILTAARVLHVHYRVKYREISGEIHGELCSVSSAEVKRRGPNVKKLRTIC